MKVKITLMIDVEPNGIDHSTLESEILSNSGDLGKSFENNDEDHLYGLRWTGVKCVSVNIERDPEEEDDEFDTEEDLVSSEGDEDEEFDD